MVLQPGNRISHLQSNENIWNNSTQTFGKTPAAEHVPKEHHYLVIHTCLKVGRDDMPLEATFWAVRFGMLVDRFGVAWRSIAKAKNNTAFSTGRKKPDLFRSGFAFHRCASSCLTHCS